MKLELEDEPLAKILIFFLKNTDAYALPTMHIGEAMQKVDPSKVDSDLFNELRDQALRRRLKLPAVWDYYHIENN